MNFFVRKALSFVVVIFCIISFSRFALAQTLIVVLGDSLTEVFWSCQRGSLSAFTGKGTKAQRAFCESDKCRHQRFLQAQAHLPVSAGI